MTGGSASITPGAGGGIGGISAPEMPEQPKAPTQLAVNNVKKVWGAPVEETKTTPSV